MLLGLVLCIGGSAHGSERLAVLALGMQNPGGRDLTLDVHDLRPVGVLGIAQLVAQFGQLGDVGLGGLRLPERAAPSARAKCVIAST